eukprot:1025242-Prymnesium_polylepis.1
MVVCCRCSEAPRETSTPPPLPADLHLEMEQLMTLRSLPAPVTSSAPPTAALNSTKWQSRRFTLAPPLTVRAALPTAASLPESRNRSPASVSPTTVRWLPGPSTTKRLELPFPFSVAPP